MHHGSRRYDAFAKRPISVSAEASNTTVSASYYFFDTHSLFKDANTLLAGFIASHLAKRLKSEGHYIVACDWKKNEHMPVNFSLCPVSK